MSTMASSQPLSQINTCRKRDHDLFEDNKETCTQSSEPEPELEAPFTVPANYMEGIEPSQTQTQTQSKPDSAIKAEDDHAIEDGQTDESLPTPPISVGAKREVSPTHSERSSTGDLTDPAPNTPPRDVTPTPVVATAIALPPSTANTTVPPSSAFAAMKSSGASTMNSSAPPPAKKAKLTFQEKEQAYEFKRLEKERKEQERAEEKAKREAVLEAEREARRQAAEAEKAQREAKRLALAAEKEAKRVAVEAEREAKRLAKEEEKRRKDEEKRAKDEEKKKKDKGQMKLKNFFAMPPQQRSVSTESKSRKSASPAPQSSIASMLASPAKSTPKKAEKSAYEKMFPDFFVQNGVTMAPANRFERDEVGTEAVQNTIDTYLTKNRSPERQRTFNATSLFHLPHNDQRRGRRCMPVREIMTEVYDGQASRPIDLTTDSQNSQIKRTADLLSRVPMKFLQFREDVRPPYRGTYTARPIHGMERLARNPLRRDLPDTNYDYDSEAEWVEDEDAEDLKSEGDEDEEIDEDEDMDGFLDDEGDEGINPRRHVLQGDLEPISTGLCWEDRKKRNTNVKMVAYRMEVILDPNIKSIDPFSTSYWEPTPSAMDPPRIPLNSMRNTSLNFNNPAISKPIKQFLTPSSADQKPLSAQSNTTAKPTTSKPKTQHELLPPKEMDEFKAVILAHPDVSKLGMQELLKSTFKGYTAARIKATLEAVTRKGRKGESKWVIVDNGGAADGSVTASACGEPAVPKTTV